MIWLKYCWKRRKTPFNKKKKKIQTTKFWTSLNLKHLQRRKLMWLDFLFLRLVERGIAHYLLFQKQSGLFITLKKRPFENIVGIGENTGNQHFLLFPECFLPFLKHITMLQSNILWPLQMLWTWTSLKYCFLVMISDLLADNKFKFRNQKKHLKSYDVCLQRIFQRKTNKRNNKSGLKAGKNLKSGFAQIPVWRCSFLYKTTNFYIRPNMTWLKWSFQFMMG